MVQAHVARDNEEFTACFGGSDWLTRWQPPGTTPEGIPTGANGLCITADGQVVLISKDGVRWDWPGGHQEQGESWEQTLRREVLEEACSTIRSARLLGFCCSTCISGPEKGVKLVHSIWLAEVELMAWQPRFEVAHRRLVAPAELFSHLWIDEGMEPLYRRVLAEAGLIYSGLVNSMRD